MLAGCSTIASCEPRRLLRAAIASCEVRRVARALIMETFGWALRPTSAPTISIVAFFCMLLVCFLVDSLVVWACSCSWKYNWCSRNIVHHLLACAFACSLTCTFLDGGASHQMLLKNAMHVRIDLAPQYDSNCAIFCLCVVLGMLQCYSIEKLVSASASREDATAAAEEVASDLLADEASAKRAEEANAKALAARIAARTQVRSGPKLVAVHASDSSGDVSSYEAQGSTSTTESDACSLTTLVGPAIAQRVHARYGWRCQLIGSALFFDGNDVDIVIEVPHSPTLADAYERVVRATGWAVVGNGAIDGQRLVSLHGEFEGAAIDAQVWRGSAKADSPAELKTQEALRMTAMLARGTCMRCQQSIRLLHRWAAASGVKGGQLGLPPGIAWTVAGTMLWQLTADWDQLTEVSRLEALLGSLISVLRTEGKPSIALGCPVRFTRTAGRCDEPLCVMLGATNVCERMSLKTTRALLIIAEGTLRLPAVQRLLPESHRRLLSSLLPIAAVAQPRSSDAIPRTLHRILSRLDGYEPVYALLVTICPATGSVRLHAILDSSTSAAKYGLHPTRHLLIEVDDDGPAAGMCRVRLRHSLEKSSGAATTRSSRVWFIWAQAEAPAGARVVAWRDAMAHSGGGTRSGAGGKDYELVSDISMAAWWQLEAPSGKCAFAPNAAYLALDLSSRFEPRWWILRD